MNRVLILFFFIFSNNLLLRICYWSLWALICFLFKKFFLLKIVSHFCTSESFFPLNSWNEEEKSLSLRLLRQAHRREEALGRSRSGIYVVRQFLLLILVRLRKFLFVPNARRAVYALFWMLKRDIASKRYEYPHELLLCVLCV